MASLTHTTKKKFKKKKRRLTVNIITDFRQFLLIVFFKSKIVWEQSTWVREKLQKLGKILKIKSYLNYRGKVMEFAYKLTLAKCVELKAVKNGMLRTLL